MSSKRLGLWERRYCPRFKGGSLVIEQLSLGSRESTQRRPEPPTERLAPHDGDPGNATLELANAQHSLLSSAQVPRGHTSACSSRLPANISRSQGGNTNGGPHTINLNIKQLKFKLTIFKIMFYPSILTDISS